MKKKKITLLISSLAGGGSERICVNIANSFAKNGWKVDLVILNTNNEMYVNFLSNDINILVLNSNRARYSSLSLLKYIFKNKPKIFLVFNKELTIILLILRFLFQLKVKILNRNNTTISHLLKFSKKQSFLEYFVFNSLIKYIYSKTDHVINQCNMMRDDLILLHPKLYKKSSVIYNPVAEHILNYGKKFDLTKIKKKNYILCVGRLEKEKAFDFAIESFAQISDRFPDLRLKIVGEGSLKQELKKKTIHFGIAGKVDFEGFKKDIIPYYLYAKATVLTSLFEGYPNVLIESIALNTPVVAFDCPSGPSEIINDGLNGYLVKYKDVDDLKKKLSNLLYNEFNYKNLENSIKKNQIENVFKYYEKLINSFN